MPVVNRHKFLQLVLVGSALKVQFSGAVVPLIIWPLLNMVYPMADVLPLNMVLTLVTSGVFQYVLAPTVRLDKYWLNAMT